MIGKYVAGEGNEWAKVFLVGEGPGRQESQIGRPFVGLSGSDLNRYLLTLCGLRRSDVYCTNIVKWRTDEDNSDPSPEDIARDEPDLLREIQLVSPEIIVPVGVVAARYFLGADFNMEFGHALPHKSEKFPGIIFFPVFHPASAMHQADKFSKLVFNSFKRLGMYLRGELTEVIDAFPEPTYLEVEESPFTLIETEVVALDTEGVPKRPWGLSYTCTPGVGYVQHDGSRWNVTASKYILHNALWDLPVLRAMGIELPYDRVHDSMILAHILCVEPKKLKALMYREAGMIQENFQDVVKEAKQQNARNYIEKALSYHCQTCGGEGTLQIPYKRQPKEGPEKFKTVKCEVCKGDKTSWGQAQPQLIFNDDFTAKIYQPQSIGRRLSGLLSRGVDLEEAWRAIDGAVRASVEAKLGKLPETTLDDVQPRNRAIKYSAADADGTLRVYNRLYPRVVSAGLEKAYEIDRGCIPIIDRMHQNGILINKEHFYELDKKFESEQLEILDKMYGEVGLYFNPASPVQMKRELGKLGLKDLDSTNERTLKLIKTQTDDQRVHRLIDYGLDYRELNKMRGTYAQPLPRQTDEFSRIHTTFILSAFEGKGDESTEAPATGRFSSRNPNLQNIPVATDRGNSLRQGFIARPGCKLLSVDLSQIELRVGAHLAREATMIDAFCSGKDLHTFTASKMFKVPYEEVDPKKQRYPAKSINFGIFYGMSKFRLQSELAIEGIEISLDEAQAFIDAWFETYPGFRSYMFGVQAEARQNNFVRSMFGHIRYLPNVHSKDLKIREEALRQAGNHPVQGTAGEILKIAMANIQATTYPEINRMGYFEPLLTVHDELIFEVEEALAELAASMVSYEMEHAVELLVPLTSSYKIADNWSELK